MANGTLSVQVPVDDGAIQRAFEQLDAQMDAWLTAMDRVERALTGKSVPSQEPATPEPMQEAECPPVAEFETASPAVAAEPEPIAAPPPVSVAPESTPAPNSPRPESVAAKWQPMELPHSPDPKSPARSSGAKENAKKHDENEALLATLDEETAKAIRVMRRLCMNSKSVKELLAEYQAKKHSQPQASAKRSWFSRGK